jgi:hypothetical protein
MTCIAALGFRVSDICSGSMFYGIRVWGLGFRPDTCSGDMYCGIALAGSLIAAFEIISGSQSDTCRGLRV